MRAFLISLVVCVVTSLDNGMALIPPRGVTTWELLNFAVSDAALRGIGDSMVQRGIKSSGYDFLWLDDGWPSCDEWVGEPGVSKCKTPSPRSADGSIIPDKNKFPEGIIATFAYLHSLGIKVGIYTAPHKQTCGGYTASLNHEAIDAATFAAWGVDAVKMDAGCQTDCSLFDGCLIASLSRMRDGLNATGRRMLYYVDDGNPTAGPRVYNPRARGWPNTSVTETHFARVWPEYVVSWGPSIANAFKIWFDRYDAFSSLMDNVKMQAPFPWFQAPGYFLHPDQMTIGQGDMSPAEERSEVFLYAVLAAPMFLSSNITLLSPEELDLITNPEILQVNADPDATMASLVSSTEETPRNERWAFDLFVKPLSDGSFVFTGVNRDAFSNHTITIVFGDGGDGSNTDVFPAGMGSRAALRDLYARVDLGNFLYNWTRTVGPHDAFIVKVTPA